jgi:curved DNA-binding protein CbpA
MKNYYSILNVPRNASQEEIKHAFRTLANKHHPDKPTGNQAIFASLSEAYAVLSNSEKRRLYDLNFNSSSSNTNTSYSYTPPRDPNICPGCGIKAPLRNVKLYQNIGLLVTRFSRKIESKLCKSCINKNFSRFTLTTFILGWWGFISFFVTIAYLINNFFVFLKTRGMKENFT